MSFRVAQDAENKWSVYRVDGDRAALIASEEEIPALAAALHQSLSADVLMGFNKTERKC